MERRIIICSDVHLCHISWYGRSSADRLEGMIRQLNLLYEERPYEKILFLGDYSLDFWEWDICGSWLTNGISNTANFVRDYVSRLKVPCFMLPGNHEQYGRETWKKITGTERDDCFEVGGYLVIAVDNFSGNLDPTCHSDGTYTATKLDFVKQKMEEHPGLPVILCSHFFDAGREPEAFYEFIRREKRITFLACGHDHLLRAEDLGERADHVLLYHDGNYSYDGTPGGPVNMWGFSEVTLRDDGAEICYIEPENTYVLNGKTVTHGAREKLRVFARRRDRVDG